MGKETITWHRECYANQAKHVERKRLEASRTVSELKRSERALQFYAEQIAMAEARKLPAFDRDRLLVKRTG